MCEAKFIEYIRRILCVFVEYAHFQARSSVFRCVFHVALWACYQYWYSLLY